MPTKHLPQRAIADHQAWAKHLRKHLHTRRAFPASFVKKRIALLAMHVAMPKLCESSAKALPNPCHAKGLLLLDCDGTFAPGRPRFLFSWGFVLDS